MTHELKPLAKWYLGSMNDGLHIQDRPAIGMNDDGPWDMPDGPNIIADVSKLGNRKAQIICDAHNAAVEAWNTRAEAQPSADVKAQQIVDIFDMHAQFYVDHAGAGKPIKIENAMEVAQKILGLLAAQPSADVVERAAYVLLKQVLTRNDFPNELEACWRREVFISDKDCAHEDAQALAAAGLLATKESAE